MILVICMSSLQTGRHRKEGRISVENLLYSCLPDDSGSKTFGSLEPFALVKSQLLKFRVAIELVWSRSTIVLMSMDQANLGCSHMG